MTGQPLLEASALAMWRGERCLFRDLDLAIHPGRALHVRGPNGSGKTTLLRILCGLVAPEDGRLQVDGAPARGADLARRAGVAWLGHADGLKLELRAAENLAFATALAGVAGGPAPDALLDRLGLTRQAHLQARALSAGQRRRLALARVLAGRHRLWVLDEPFTALDADGCELLAGLMDEALADGVAIVFTSHQAAPLASSRVDVLDLAGHTP